MSDILIYPMVIPFYRDIPKISNGYPIYPMVIQWLSNGYPMGKKKIGWMMLSLPFPGVQGI